MEHNRALRLALYRPSSIDIKKLPIKHPQFFLPQGSVWQNLPQRRDPLLLGTKQSQQEKGTLSLPDFAAKVPGFSG